MSEAEKLYHAIADELPDATKSKMFGALCVKAVNGKAGVMFWKDYLVLKLPDAAMKNALALEGAQIFAPMEGRPMNGWVQISYLHHSQWGALAKEAMAWVAMADAKKKK